MIAPKCNTPPVDIPDLSETPKCSLLYSGQESEHANLGAEQFLVAIPLNRYNGCNRIEYILINYFNQIASIMNFLIMYFKRKNKFGQKIQ